VVLYKSQYACEAPGDDGEVVFTTMYGDLFVPILFLIYNFCDLVGRLIAGNFKLVYTPKTILPGALVRLLVIPLILFSDLKNSRLPVIVSSDVWAIFLMVIFGLSNGHLTGSSMILGMCKTYVACILFTCRLCQIVWATMYIYAMYTYNWYTVLSACKNMCIHHTHISKYYLVFVRADDG
jgi:hypothetical protein